MAQCLHLGQANIDPDVEPVTTEGCQECLELGEQNWVQLRKCLTCGHVGCCDSSPSKHATKHFKATGHPIIESYKSSKKWKWCYVDETYIDQN